MTVRLHTDSQSLYILYILRGEYADSIDVTNTIFSCRACGSFLFRNERSNVIFEAKLANAKDIDRFVHEVRKGFAIVPHRNALELQRDSL